MTEPKDNVGRKKGVTDLAVCERRHAEWLDYSGGMTKKELMKKYMVKRRTLDRDLKAWEDELMEKLRAHATDDAAAKALTNYYRVFNKAIEMMAMAEEEKDPKAKYQGMRSALSEMRGAQRDMDSLLVKAGYYEGDKASVTVNILSMPEDDAYGVVEKAMEKPEFAQALCNLLEAKGFKPDVEGEYEILNEDNQEKAD